MPKPLNFCKFLNRQFFLIAFIFVCQSAIGQIGIGLPAGEAPEATLDVGFSNDVAPGFLMPRVSSFPTPEPGETMADGLLVFLSSEYVDQNGVTYPSSHYVFIDGEWKSLAETAGIITPGGGGGCPNVGDYIESEAGVVFWVASDCSSYKIVSLVNLSYNGDDTLDWGPYDSVSGADSNTNGAQNTADWISQFSSNGSVPSQYHSYFPYVAHTFNAGSGSGWYLGAPDEYTTLRDNQTTVQSGIDQADTAGETVDNITDSGYYFWTSREYNSTYAYRIRWNDGDVNPFRKQQYNRWARAFKEIQL